VRLYAYPYPYSDRDSNGALFTTHVGGALEGEGSLEERNYRSSQFENNATERELFCNTQNVLKLVGARANSSKLRHLDGSLTQHTPII
jgi:hypothetical protein